LSSVDWRDTRSPLELGLTSDTYTTVILELRCPNADVAAAHLIPSKRVRYATIRTVSRLFLRPDPQHGYP